MPLISIWYGGSPVLALGVHGEIVLFAKTTIYEMERRGEFPRRFNLTPRCVLWDLAEVEAWIEARKQAPRDDVSKPDVHLRKTRPVRACPSEE